jgi:hypothetical protein
MCEYLNMDENAVEATHVVLDNIIPRKNPSTVAYVSFKIQTKQLPNKIHKRYSSKSPYCIERCPRTFSINK